MLIQISLKIKASTNFHQISYETSLTISHSAFVHKFWAYWVEACTSYTI